MTRYGTNCFTTKAAAVRYYRNSGFDCPEYTVEDKLMNGEIRIGKPLTTKTGDELVVIDGRYHVEEKS